MADGLTFWQRAMGWKRVAYRGGPRGEFVRTYAYLLPEGADPDPPDHAKLQALYSTLEGWTGDGALRGDPELNQRVRDLYLEARGIHDRITKDD